MSFSFREYKRVMPRVAAVHDLCGYGNCSLGVALPVLSAGGIDACAVPTAYLSAHTAFPSYRFFDTTENLESYLNHWQAIDIHLDGIYTGFLGSAQQIDIITDFAAHHPEACIVVDPVMADHGKIYKTYTPEMCRKMKDLAVISHVLTPNLTEAAVLLDEEYEGQAISLARAQELCEKLLELGPEQVVLKGILQGEDKIINMVADKKSNRFETTVHVLRHHAPDGTVTCLRVRSVRHSSMTSPCWMPFSSPASSSAKRSTFRRGSPDSKIAVSAMNRSLEISLISA